MEFRTIKRSTTKKSVSPQKAFIEQFPTDMLREIFYKLSYKHIIETCTTSKRFAELCQDEDLWKLLMKRDFNMSVKFDPKLTWKQNYKVYIPTHLKQFCEQCCMTENKYIKFDYGLFARDTLIEMNRILCNKEFEKFDLDDLYGPFILDVLGGMFLIGISDYIEIDFEDIEKVIREDKLFSELIENYIKDVTDETCIRNAKLSLHIFHKKHKIFM